MLSLRLVGRCAPRALSRMSASSALRSSASNISRANTSAFLKPSVLSAVRSTNFSTTSMARKAEQPDEASLELKEELLAKLDSEISIENDMKSSEQAPASIKDFLDNTPFELVDAPGQEIVKLTRTYGDEKITVSFSIADITNYDPFSEESALDDEELGEEGLSRSEKSSAGDREIDELEEDLDEEGSAPINLSIVIEKPGKLPSALNIDATTQDGNIIVENMFYYEDAQVARVDSPEAAQKRADVYPGPPFNSLDEDLQVLMEKFLEARGITQAMAVFVVDYVDVKEQQEYVRWLNNVRGFIEA